MRVRTFLLGVSLGIALAACGSNGNIGNSAGAVATQPSENSPPQNLETPSAETEDGPSNMDIRNALHDYEVMRIPGHGFETFDRIKDIRHGKPLEATGGGDIPAGTPVYPIKVDSSDGKDYVFAFYQDSFGEWKFQRM
jgi:hypothetical protein